VPGITRRDSICSLMFPRSLKHPQYNKINHIITSLHVRGCQVICSWRKKTMNYLKYYSNRYASSLFIDRDINFAHSMTHNVLCMFAMIFFIDSVTSRAISPITQKEVQKCTCCCSSNTCRSLVLCMRKTNIKIRSAIHVDKECLLHPIK
jgi:hypothetical protein